jgi:hypothetical protein
MSGKRVAFGLKPGVQKRAEEWVTDSAKSGPEAEEGAPIALKRLTIDVPADLHRRLKVKAAVEGVRMADLLRSWIEEKCAP